MDEQKRWDTRLEALLEEHFPPKTVVAWTMEDMSETGIGPPENVEDIPDEVGFRVRQRMIEHLAERASEPLATELRATYRYNEEHGLEGD